MFNTPLKHVNHVQSLKSNEREVKEKSALLHYKIQQQ